MGDIKAVDEAGVSKVGTVTIKGTLGVVAVAAAVAVAVTKTTVTRGKTILKAGEGFKGAGLNVVAMAET